MSDERVCCICGGSLQGKRSNAILCSVVCKKEYKHRYDLMRYQDPQIRQTSIDRAVKWERDNPQRKQQYDAEYRKGRPESAKIAKALYAREYQKRPKTRLRAKLNSHNRRAKLYDLGQFKITLRDINRLFQRYNNCCAYCGSSTKLELDHIIPVARGGRQSIGNLVPACRTCNSSKNSRYIMEWRVGLVVPRVVDTKVQILVPVVL